jgi:hypothetical protein
VDASSLGQLTGPQNGDFRDAWLPFSQRVPPGKALTVHVTSGHLGFDEYDLSAQGLISCPGGFGRSTPENQLHNLGLTTETIGLYGNPAGTHPERLIAACWRLGHHPGYVSLRRWAHMLGFGGHFLTKARRYSIRFCDLREARIIYRRTHDTGPEHRPIRTGDHADDETTLIVGTLTYAGSGWQTTGDALLANTAADQARKRRQAGHDQLADEYDHGTTGRQAA